MACGGYSYLAMELFFKLTAFLAVKILWIPKSFFILFSVIAPVDVNSLILIKPLIEKYIN